MSVEVRIFDPPEAGAPTFRSAGRATAAVSVSTVERHFAPGSFRVEIPTGARHGDKLRIGRLVLIRSGAPAKPQGFVGRGGARERAQFSPQAETELSGLCDDDFWGIIDDLSMSADTSGDMLTASGRQLKGLALDRITIPPAFTAVTGAQGYDPAGGTTEAVMKHFVDVNLGPGAQAGRAVFGLELAPDLGRGVAEDKYMSRHEVLADVLSALGEASGLGYDILPDLKRHRFVFDVVEGEDHTARQSERKRVVFDLRRKTAQSQRYELSASDSRNLFYATLAGSEFADETLTVTYTREGEETPAGIRRREKHLSISADTPVAGAEYEELRRLALIEMEGFRPAESFACDIIEGPYRYGTDYRVGDLVSVQNQDWGVGMHARLTEMKTDWTSSGVRRSATFGTAPLNVFGRLKRQIQKG